MYLFEFLDTVDRIPNRDINIDYSLSNGNRLRYLGYNKYDLYVKWFLVDFDGFKQVNNQIFIEDATIEDMDYQMESMTMQGKSVDLADGYKLYMFDSKRGVSRFKVFLCVLDNKVIDIVVCETMMGLLSLKVRKLGRGITLESKFGHKIYIDLLEGGEFTVQS